MQANRLEDAVQLIGQGLQALVDKFGGKLDICGHGNNILKALTNQPDTRIAFCPCICGTYHQRERNWGAITWADTCIFCYS